MPGVACEYLMGVFTNLTGPQSGWSTSVTIPRAWTMLMYQLAVVKLLGCGNSP